MIKGGAWEKAQSAKFLPYNHEDPSSDFLHPYKNLGMVGWAALYLECWGRRLVL